MKAKYFFSAVLIIISSIQMQAQTVVVVERYPNDLLKQTITTAADSSYVVLTDYFKNGKKQSVDTLVNDHINGWSTEYNSDGNVYVSQLFDFDRPIIQKFYLYYKDGKIKSEWTSDTLGRVKDATDIIAANGYWKEYYHNGKLKMEGRKNQNKNYDGVWIYYDENGVEAKRIFYIDGKKLDN